MAENLKLFIDRVEMTQGDGVLSKLNLKVLVKCEGKKYQTKITYEGGNKPEFKEQFDLGNCKAELIEIEVLDVGAFSEQIVGACKICLDQLKIGKGVQEMFTLLNNNLLTGQIHIKSIYQGLAMQSQQQFQQPQAMPTMLQYQEPQNQMMAQMTGGYGQPQYGQPMMGAPIGNPMQQYGMPPQMGMMPPQMGMMPPQMGMMPPQMGMMPPQMGMMPQQMGMMQLMPQQMGTMPQQMPNMMMPSMANGLPMTQTTTNTTTTININMSGPSPQTQAINQFQTQPQQKAGPAPAASKTQGPILDDSFILGPAERKSLNQYLTDKGFDEEMPLCYQMTEDELSQENMINLCADNTYQIILIKTTNDRVLGIYMPDTMVNTCGYEEPEGWVDWKSIEDEPFIFFFINGEIQICYPQTDNFTSYSSTDSLMFDFSWGIQVRAEGKGKSMFRKDFWRWTHEGSGVKEGILNDLPALFIDGENDEGNFVVAEIEIFGA